MGLLHAIAHYREMKSGVKHCTFNPNGPGVVRIHLIPPKFRLLRRASYVVILNGYYLLPLGYSWAVMLSAFMKEVNAYDGREIGEREHEAIIEATIRQTRRVYPFVDKGELREDLLAMLDVLFAVARGEASPEDIEAMSIRAYRAHMYAPHRMDLMVRAMSDGEGRWACNQKCLFCYAAGEPLAKTKEMPTEQWKAAIDKLKAAGVPMLTFTGGEPTLREDLCELIAYSQWFVTRLNTNGVLLSEALCRELCRASLDSVQITLYSHREDVHNTLVGASHFHETVAGIQHAVAAGLDVSINTPLCKENADYVQTLSFIHSLGVRFVTVSGLICTGTAEGRHADYDLSGDELFEIVKEAKAFCDAHGMEIDFTSPGLIEKDKLEQLSMHVPMCGACLSNMAIAPDGTVLPCQSWLSAEGGLGHILTDRFRDIWEHRACRSLRDMSEREALGCPFRKRGTHG